MSAEAIVMMVVAMLILWGGLAVAIWNISRDHPRTSEPAPGPDGHRDL